MRRSAMPSTPAKPSIVLVTIDCLRADHVGCLGYSRDITPVIDGIAKESLVFSQALVAGSPTYGSFPALLAGRFPLALGRDLVGLSPDETTIASYLQDQGYRTGAIVAGNPYVSRWMGYDRGFEYFEDFLKDQRWDSESKTLASKGDEPTTWLRRLNRTIQNLANRSAVLHAIYQEIYFAYGLWAVGRRHGGDYYALLNRYPRADTVTDKAITWLEEVSEPFFLWIHYMDPHRPYCPSVESLAKLGRTDISPKKMFKLRNIWLRRDLSARRLHPYREDFLALYDASISFVDSQLGRLLRALGNLAVLDKTLIVLTADHGEAFLEHGERDHYPVNATQEIIRVPLLIRLPASQQTVGNIGLPFSLIDLPPTILDMAGFGCSTFFAGQSRWPALKSGKPWQTPAITEMIYSYDLNPREHYNIPGQRLLAATGDRHKMVVNFAKGSFELFDLNLDPKELNGQPLATNHKASRALLSALKSHLEKSMHGRHSMPEILMRLEKIKELIFIQER